MRSSPSHCSHGSRYRVRWVGWRQGGVLHSVRGFWIDCSAGVGRRRRMHSINFSRARASRGCGQPAFAPGTVLRDGEEARARLGTPLMHRPPRLPALTLERGCAQRVCRTHLATRARDHFSFAERPSPRGAWQGACQTARASGLALEASRKKTGTLGEEDGNNPRASQKRPCVPKLRIPYVYLFPPASYLTPVLCNIPTAATRPSL